MQFPDFIVEYTGKTFAALFGGPNPLVQSRQVDADTIAITSWDASLGAPPTPAQIAAALAGGPSKAALTAYANEAWSAVLAKGQVFDVAAAGAAPVNILCDGANTTRADLGLLALFGQTNPSGSKTWIDNAGVSTVLTGAELVQLSTLAGNWIADTYPALQILLGQIAAGTVTTTAQVDAYAWPTS